MFKLNQFNKLVGPILGTIFLSVLLVNGIPKYKANHDIFLLVSLIIISLTIIAAITALFFKIAIKKK